MKIKISFILVVIFFISSNVFAQATSPDNMPELNGKQKYTLSLLAKEAVDAYIENRTPRQATVDTRLMATQSMVVSIYVGNKLRARTWSLKFPRPIYQEVYLLINEAIEKSKIKTVALTVNDLAVSKVTITLLSNYQKAKDDRDIPPHSAVIIYNGFIEWLALPGDISSKKNSDLLSYACKQAGLRANVWLLPETVIYSASIDEVTREILY